MNIINFIAFYKAEMKKMRKLNEMLNCFWTRFPRISFADLELNETELKFANQEFKRITTFYNDVINKYDNLDKDNQPGYRR